MRYNIIIFSPTNGGYSPDPNGALVCGDNYIPFNPSATCFIEYPNYYFTLVRFSGKNVTSPSKIYFSPEVITFASNGLDSDDYRMVYIYEMNDKVNKTYPTAINVNINYYEWEILYQSNTKPTIKNNFFELYNPSGTTYNYTYNLLALDGYNKIPVRGNYSTVEELVIAKPSFPEGTIRNARPSIKTGKIMHPPKFFIDTDQEYYWELTDQFGVCKRISNRKTLTFFEYEKYDKVRILNKRFASQFYYLNEINAVPLTQN
ncbi:hypothetical protein AVL50_00950 [Flammeovirga sp. SJP92]|nr:hypothetical protein AVL50_00950 [Flammeovirga sp. SJP92]